MKIYALVEHTYDYYEWSEVMVVSDEIEKLKLWHAENMPSTPLINIESYERYANREECHVIIEEIDFI